MFTKNQIVKNQIVFYVAGADLVRARVLIAHKDGTCKVEAMFFNEEGKDTGPYLGFVYDGVTPFTNAMDAINRTRRERAPDPVPFPRPGMLYEGEDA